MQRIGAWLDERLGIYALGRSFLDRKVPGNIGWWHTFGSATLVLILVQVATGIALTMSYVPSPEHAYDSILYIDATPFGALVRGIHHWSAGLLVLLIGLHILRVFVWGAYKYPRELAWVGGALLFFVILGFGFTGYLLPWDQKAYWATVVGTNIAGSAPLVGGGVLELLRGGQQLGAVTLTRFYGIHIWVLPATLAILVVFHLFGVIRQGIAASPRRDPLTQPIAGETRRETYEREYAAEKSTGKPFWDALLKDAIVALFVVLLVVTVAYVAGAPLEQRANPNATNYAPRPEWYFLDLFQMLWYFGGPLEPLIDLRAVHARRPHLHGGALHRPQPDAPSDPPAIRDGPRCDRGHRRPVAHGHGPDRLAGGRRGRATPYGHDHHPAQWPRGLQYPGLRRLSHHRRCRRDRRTRSVQGWLPMGRGVHPGPDPDPQGPAHAVLRQALGPGPRRPRRVPRQPPVAWDRTAPTVRCSRRRASGPYP